MRTGSPGFTSAVTAYKFDNRCRQRHNLESKYIRAGSDLVDEVLRAIAGRDGPALALVASVRAFLDAVQPLEERRQADREVVLQARVELLLRERDVRVRAAARRVAHGEVQRGDRERRRVRLAREQREHARGMLEVQHRAD